ncbi:MAG TPA: Fe-S cluster assembly protein SufD [Terriglobales bacterium]|nr:Fe-S cluster assembly protein SufD [Terriglobales bacterium]
MTTAVKNIEAYLESFTEFAKRAAGNNLPWLKKLREDAFARFCETGFPTTHDEDWRFTNVAAIAKAPFKLAEKSTVSESDLQPWRLENATAQLVFVDGQFVRGLSRFTTFPASVVVSGLKEEIINNAQALEAHLGRYLNQERDPFVALNTAFAEDGAFVHVGRGVSLDAPIHVLFVSTKTDAPRMMHPRNLLIFEQESQATVIEEYISLGRGTVLCNTATELFAGENANVSHFMLEREHGEAFNISTLRLQLERSANVSSHSLLLGGSLVRNNIHPVLAGEGGECLINGLFVGDGTQHLDNYMHVEHAAPHCASRQFYNGILDGKSHGVFHGRIVVHKDAQKTDAKQTNRNLLLSDDAQIDTKPQLEIYADDVKCTHGATIGQIEENALFYLRSRAIDEVSARRMLLMAFASECLDRMKPGIARDHSERLIQEHLLTIANHIAGVAAKS